MKPQKQCNHAGCNKLVDYTTKYCEKHEAMKKPQQTDSFEYKRKKYGKYHAFYKTRHWRRLSELQRIKQPLCEMCLEQGIIKKADVADHIIEIRDDWSKRYDDSNIMSLCHSCHWIKSKEEREKRKQKK